MTIINKGIFDTADVFLRQTGNDWPTAQVLSTSDITEGVNLYFTNARVNAAVSGNLALKANVSDLTSANISELTNLYYTNARVLSFVSSLLTTSNVAEGSNLYYTNTRVISAVLPYLTTSNVAEGSNLYYTNARVYAAIEGNLAAKANVTDLTTANVAELTNLYYTNARVYSNVIALLPTLAGSGITIQANGQINASTATVSLAGLTTSNLAEGTNLYYTNTRAVSAFTEGSGIAISSGGVISARGDSAGSGLFNSGIQLVGNTLAQSTFSNVKVFSFAEGNTFIGYSFHVTNITSNIVYLTGRHVFDSNTTLFANLLEMPVGASMEVFRKPQVFRANDIIQIQGFDQNRTAVNNGISSYLSYQATVDDTYQRAGNTITGNALTTIYQTVGRVSIFESINLVNLSPNVIYGTVIVTDGSDNIVAYLAANLAIPAYASVDVCEYPKTLLDDYKIKVQKSDNFNPLSVFTSSKFTQSFAVTPSSNNMTESGTITLDLVTTNIVNGTVLYYSITGASGNINQTDFVTNTTGTVTVQNNAVRLTLQANADLNTNLEGDETFTVVYRKNSNVGTVVATSSSIILRDTSNVTVYALTSNVASSIPESTDVLFTLSTINLPPGTTHYWNTNNISSYFVTSNTGSFVSNANTSYNILLAANAMAAGTSTDFQLRILTGSQTGTVVATSNVITIVDSAIAYMSATGGTIVDISGYRTHTFNTSSNLNITRLGVSTALNTAEYLVVGGGGSGAAAGGGGGGGGILSSTATFTQTGNNVIQIGGGGTGGAVPYGNNGSPSNIIFNSTVTPSTIEALGGGGGGSVGDSTSSPANTQKNGRPGGSGGGAGGNFYGGVGGNGTPGQGNPGGTANTGPSKTLRIGGSDGIGGGGGGSAGDGGRAAGDGGAGGLYSISGYSTYYAGGGGGADAFSPLTIGGSGGAGGGGRGTTYPSTDAQPGVINSGGGGGSDWSGGPSGAGGSGKVIIRYPYVPNLPNVNVLVVAAGGGGGGGQSGGGGGAGGYRSNSFAIANAYTVYTVVVGGGGAGGTSFPTGTPVAATRGITGSDSTFSSITSAGGGGGGCYDATTPNGNGKTGGSGGGGGGYGPGGVGTGGAGTPGQGFAGGDTVTDSTTFTCGGGGGGAGAVGANGSPASAGSGGGGVPSFISGSNVMYAGGGGGGTDTRTPGTGGLGGGGPGGGRPGSTPSTPGNVNTGGGGGGHNVFGGGAVGGGAGGSGVVIISYPTAYANATVLGSNVITTAANGNIIHSFYASGNIMFTG